MGIEANFPSSVDDLRRRYGDATALRASVRLIPWIGGALDALIAGKASAVVQRRIDQLLGDLRDAMAKLIGPEVDQQWIDSLDYAHLIILAVEQTARTRQREKIRAYALLLTNAVTHGWVGRADQAEELLHTLADLSLNELAVLRAVWQLERERREKESKESHPFEKSRGESAQALEPRLPGMSRSEIRAYLARLQRTGLVVLNFGEGAWYDLGDNFTVTDLLDRLMAILREPGQ